MIIVVVIMKMILMIMTTHDKDDNGDSVMDEDGLVTPGTRPSAAITVLTKLHEVQHTDTVYGINNAGDYGNDDDYLWF